MGNCIGFVRRKLRRTAPPTEGVGGVEVPLEIVEVESSSTSLRAPSPPNEGNDNESIAVASTGVGIILL